MSSSRTIVETHTVVTSSTEPSLIASTATLDTMTIRSTVILANYSTAIDVSEPWLTVAGAIDAVTIRRAVVGASNITSSRELFLTPHTGPTSFTNASFFAINHAAATVSRTVVWAWLIKGRDGTIHATPLMKADAGTIDTVTLTIAIIVACGMTTIDTSESWRAEAETLNAFTVAMTIIRAHFFHAIDSSPMAAAVAGAVDAETVSVAVVRAHRDRAVPSTPTNLANTG